MSFTVRIGGGFAGMGLDFACDAGETLLAAAARAGVVLPYSCRRGTCLSCEATLEAGRVRQGAREIAGPAEILACTATPLTDLVLAPRRAARADPAGAPREVEATLYRVTRPLPDVAVVQLRFPAGTRARFRAGQYLEVLLPDGARRPYSMANPPQENDGVQLHVRVHPGGAFSDALLGGLAPGARLRVSLPHGEASPSEDPAKPLVLLATGTGFAPAKSIIEDLAKRRAARPVTLYRGARRQADLYLDDLPAKWAARLPGFRYVPVLSRPDPGWAGRTGHVQDAAAADHPDLSGAEAHACGSPAMTEAARALLTGRCGLPVAAFLCDAFLPAPDGTPPAAAD